MRVLTGGRKKKLIGILLVLPCLIVLVLMMAMPVVQIFTYSFSNIQLPHFKLSFAGLNNFKNVFAQPDIWLVVKNTIVWTIFSVLLQMLLGLGSGLVMSANVKGIGALRVIALLPWTVPSIVAANSWRWIFQGDYGVLNGTLKAIGLGKIAIPWLANTTTAMPAVLTAFTWAQFPFVMMMVVSAMQGLSRDMYEAAEIEGASGFKMFRYITFPGIKPVLTVVFALQLMGSINAFDTMYVMTGGGPANATEILGLFIYKLAFSNYDFSTASAVSVILLVIAILGFCLYAPAQKLSERKGNS